MKIHAVITSILLASSSIAIADTNVRVESNELWRRPTRLVWSPLTEMMSAQRTNTIKIENCEDELRSLRLQNGTGATYIYSLMLQFEDGSRENVNVGRWLYWGAPTFNVDLPNRRTGIERISVSTWTWYRSTYQVFGQRMERTPGPLPLPPPPPPPLPTSSIVIGKDLTFARTGGYIQLPVGAEKGMFGKLRIEATGAVAHLGRIYVAFPNGSYQTLDVNKPLYRGQVLNLDLTGGKHAIRAVTLMAGDDLGSVGDHAKFTVSLL
jgi:hypothetical protein